MDLHHLRNIERWTLYLVPAAFLLGLFFGLPEASGAAVGAAVTAANFAGIRRLAEKLTGASSARQSKLMILLGLKFGVLLLLVGLIVRYAPINRIAFLFGFSTFLPAIGFEWVRGVLSDDETSGPVDETTPETPATSSDTH